MIPVPSAWVLKSDLDDVILTRVLASRLPPMALHAAFRQEVIITWIRDKPHSKKVELDDAGLRLFML